MPGIVFILCEGFPPGAESVILSPITIIYPEGNGEQAALKKVAPYRPETVIMDGSMFFTMPAMSNAAPAVGVNNGNPMQYRAWKSFTYETMSGRSTWLVVFNRANLSGLCRKAGRRM